MSLVAIVAVLALLEYSVFVVMTGQARGKYGIPAPSITGDPTFERTFRVQQNTVEQLVVFLPALFLCAHFASETLAALLGLVFIVGRALYARGYVQDPAKRGPGFLLTLLANGGLMLGALIGAVAERV